MIESLLWFLVFGFWFFVLSKIKIIKKQLKTTKD